MSQANCRGFRWLRALIMMFTMLGLSVAMASSNAGRSCDGSPELPAEDDWYTHPMTTLLEEAFERVSRLPKERQDRWARWILDGVDDENDWFGADTGFDVLARQARQEYEAGLSEPLEDLLAEVED